MLLAGITVVAWAMVDVFQSVIVPRAPTLRYRISMIVWRGMWKTWPLLARSLYPRDEAAREEFFATFAPFALIAMILTWVIVLIFGYGAMLWGLRRGLAPLPHSYWDTSYFAGTSLLTLGFGDIVARQGAARLVSLVAGATGFGIFSITTAYLFAIFGTFQRRESFIVSFAARAGAPPSAIGLFEAAAETGTQSRLDDVMRDAQEWVASLMESHLAYPVLAFFRSSHDDQSWVGTLGALLDVSLIADTILDDRGYGEARMCLRIGRHAVHDLADFFGTNRRTRAASGIARKDFEDACDRLAAAGYALRDRDTAWPVFARIRGEYAAYLDAMAHFFQIPPVAWLGGSWMPHAMA